MLRLWLAFTVDEPFGMREQRSPAGWRNLAQWNGSPKWKKLRYPLKAGDIVRILQKIASDRGIIYNNKAIRYGLS